MLYGTRYQQELYLYIYIHLNEPVASRYIHTRLLSVFLLCEIIIYPSIQNFLYIYILDSPDQNIMWQHSCQIDQSNLPALRNCVESWWWLLVRTLDTTTFPVCGWC